MNNTRTQEKFRQWMFGVSLGLWVFGAVGAMAAPVPAIVPRPDGKPGDMAKKVKVYILAGQSNMVGSGSSRGPGRSIPSISWVAPIRRSSPA